VTSVAIALAFVLSVLALLHVAWAIRGMDGQSVTIPKVAGRPAFVPSRASALLVAAALFSAAGVALLQGGVVRSVLPARLVAVCACAAGAAFLLRAIGDFRLVGFFKRVRGTDFARWDYFCFAPLCILIGSAFLYLAFG
jgi:hypothetical protein